MFKWVREKYTERKTIQILQNRLRVSIDKKKICNKNTDVVIDGYPRSGNSYCVHLIEMYNPNLSISHHTHLPNNIRLAKLLKKTTIVLIRSPKDAILSNHIYSGEEDLYKLCNDYVDYYKLIFDFRYYVNIIVFEELILNPEYAYDLTELSCGYKIKRPRIIEEVEVKIRDKHKKKMDKSLLKNKSGLPSAERNELKKKLSRKVDNYLAQRNDVIDIHRKIIDFLKKNKRG